MTAIGLALFAFHFQEEYAAVDTLLVCLGGYVCFARLYWRVDVLICE